MAELKYLRDSDSADSGCENKLDPDIAAKLAALPLLLNVRQVEAVLGCSTSNVYSLIEQGRLRKVLVGKKKGIRVVRSSLAEMLNSVTRD